MKEIKRCESWLMHKYAGQFFYMHEDAGGIVHGK